MACRKDNNGSYAELELAAELHITPLDEGDAMEFQLRAATPETVSDTGEWQPTGLMQKASDWLAKQTEPRSQKEIIDALGSKEKYVKAALEALIAGEYIVMEKGARGAHMHTHKKPYKAPTSSDAACGDTSSDPFGTP